MTITACTASHPMLVMERCLLGWKTNLFFLSIPLLYGGFCGENLDELKRWWVSSTTDCARQKTRVNNIFSHLTFFILSYPLESMMESTEATESMTSLYDNIGKTTVVSTLDSCKGSKLREVENS